MLSCVIDGQVKSFNLNGADSLATMLEGVNSDLVQGGRFIASLKVDGEEVSGNTEEAGRRLDGIDSIEITTETPVSLVGKILAEGDNYIDGLRDFLIQVAGNYSAGRDGADGAFAEAVQGLQWFVQMTDFIECTLGLDFRRLSLNGRPVAEYVNSLNGILQETLDAQEGCDPVMLADLLEYDLVPHLEQWKDIYALFQGELAVKQAM
jgi:hypothetical protein